jgi:nitrogen fixation/metabolism regulation signal transduction histidine kinase
MAEIFLNALQSNPGEPKVQVHAQIEGRHNGGQWVQLDVCDNGAGFSAEVLEKGPQPFYTTRSVGLGLGLTVSRRIIENHAGKLDLLPAKPGQPGGVRITLPLELPQPVTPPGAGKSASQGG